MKKSKLAVISISLFFFLFVFSAAAHAKWYSCSIKEVGGTSSNKVLVRLTDSKGAFNNRWFEVNGPSEKSILAVLLTAAATKSRVRVSLPSRSQYSKIARCYMVVK